MGWSLNTYTPKGANNLISAHQKRKWLVCHQRTPILALTSAIGSDLLRWQKLIKALVDTKLQSIDDTGNRSRETAAVWNDNLISTCILMVGFQTLAIDVKGRVVVQMIMVITVVEKRQLIFIKCLLYHRYYLCSVFYIIIICRILLCTSFMSSEIW